MNQHPHESGADALIKKLHERPHLPLADQGLAWLPPSLVMLLIVALVDRLKGAEQVSVHS